MLYLTSLLSDWLFVRRSGFRFLMTAKWKTAGGGEMLWTVVFSFYPSGNRLISAMAVYYIVIPYEPHKIGAVFNQIL